MGSGAAPTLLVVGDVLTDVTVTGLGSVAASTDTPARVAIGGGGAAANTAAWSSALGITTTFCGRVGDDPWGAVADDLLTELGVRTELARDELRPTGTCVVLVRADGSRDLVVDPGASGALDSADLPDPGRFAWVHLSGYPLLHEGSRPAAVGLLAAARAAGVACSVDPASVAPLRALGAAHFADLVHGVEVLFPNAAEAEVLTGHADPLAAARDLLDTAAEVVVTLGPDGALSLDRSGLVVRSPAAVAADTTSVAVHSTGAAVDTTGAGDAFAAGWIAARLGGADRQRQLDAGNACAALVVCRTGTRPLPRRRSDGPDQR